MTRCPTCKTELSSRELCINRLCPRFGRRFDDSERRSEDAGYLSEQYPEDDEPDQSR